MRGARQEAAAVVSWVEWIAATKIRAGAGRSGPGGGLITTTPAPPRPSLSQVTRSTFSTTSSRPSPKRCTKWSGRDLRGRARSRPHARRSRSDSGRNRLRPAGGIRSKASGSGPGITDLAVCARASAAWAGCSPRPTAPIACSRPRRRPAVGPGTRRARTAPQLRGRASPCATLNVAFLLPD
jgi:hypothetical protein